MSVCGGVLSCLQTESKPGGRRRRREGGREVIVIFIYFLQAMIQPGASNALRPLPTTTSIKNWPCEDGEKDSPPGIGRYESPSSSSSPGAVLGGGLGVAIATP